ncbi:MAG: mRNA surveillance protein pelota [Thermoplasmata archaeon]
MKVLKRDLRAGSIKLLPQNLDDLWHLYNLVESGDFVRATTFRREERRSDKIRPERGEKVRLKLGIRVEKVEFHEFSDRLRIHGLIEEGAMDLGSYHTLNVGPGDALEIVKEWRGSQLRRIKEAVEATEKPLTTLVALDDEVALVAEMHQYGVREVAEIRSRGGGKLYPSEPSKEGFFAQILEKLRQLEPPPGLVVLGPGFTRENFLKYGREKEPGMFEKVYSFATGHGGMTGIQEALKGGLATRVLEDSRVAVETRFVERLLEEIAQEGVYAYGPEEVSAAVEAGAVETLLVTDEMARSKEVEELMSRVEGMRGKILVVSSHHEAGRKLRALGGVAALLRFRIR